MLSLENLAWRTSDRPGFTYDDLPVCERGPNGGRIMWFPPYDLKFSDDIKKYKKYKRAGSYYYSKTQSQGSEKRESNTGLDLKEAYGLLGVTPDASWEEVQKAYKEKIAKSVSVNFFPVAP